MQNLIGDTTMGLLSRSLDAAFTRQEVIANNIANHNTPGFKKSRVAFEEYLQQALGGDGKKLPLWKTNPRHFGAYDSIDAVKAENKKITQ
ncbi:MAG: flagellar basal body rod protein FlgB, partial [Clostridia bacterium]|nr:flagellar basal body rod protein FlgB [Clostridia bacterium]